MVKKVNPIKTPKPKKVYDSSDKLSIHNEMAAVDNKDYSFYDSLTPEEQKKLSPFILLKWASTVEGSKNLAGYYTISTNENVNTEFWSLSKHKKLQWLLLCCISPGIGKQKHYWLGSGTKNKNSKIKKIMIENFPNYKNSDIDLLLQLNSEKDIEEWLSARGIQIE